jgi:drug/metabolite transporter (DMT)-like permease
MAAPMTTAALALVLASAFCHSGWNFLLKRSDHKIAFLACSTGIGVVIFTIPAVVVTIEHGIGLLGLAMCLVTAVLHGVYGLSLTRGYRIGDLSLIYPISRGSALAFIPLLAVLLLDESISSLAWIGIALVLAGVYSINLDPHALRDLLAPIRALAGPTGRAALLTGILIAIYSLWDKRALDEVSPLTLNQFAMVGHTLILAPFALAGGSEVVRAEWRLNGRSMLLSGLLTPMAYLLILAALTTSEVAYIAPSREIGIVFGTAMGAIILHEAYGPMRVGASLFIVAGVFLLAVAP